MKLKQLAVMVSNKKGDVYEVGLTKDEQVMVADLISQIQGGKLKIKRPKIESISLI